MMQRIHIPTN